VWARPPQLVKKYKKIKENRVASKYAWAGPMNNKKIKNGVCVG